MALIRPRIWIVIFGFLVTPCLDAMAKPQITKEHFWLGEKRAAVCRTEVAEGTPQLLGIAPALNSRGNPGEPLTAGVQFWNEMAMDMIAKYQRNPLRASRVIALLNTSFHDAMACVVGQEQAGVLRAAAVEAVGAELLSYFFPQEPENRFAVLASARLASFLPGAISGEVRSAWDLGHGVAQVAMERATNDGADATWQVDLRPPTSPAVWRATPPAYANNPVEPLAGNWRTWVLKDGGEIQPSPPVPFGSPEFIKEAEEVLRVRQTLTPEQKSIAERWHLDQGTVTPIGVWNREALRLIRAGKLSDLQIADLLSSQGVAMADASIACWNVKYRYWTVRPVTVIRDSLDKDFMPYLVTPGFPSYVSGHASVSGAAAEVLANYFPKQAKALQAMAEEAAMSRLYGGIHYRSDNEEGLKLGRAIGQRVLSAAGRKPAREPRQRSQRATK